MPFPDSLKPHWREFMARPSAEAFWRYANHVVEACDYGRVTEHEAAYALIDAMVNSQPAVVDDEDIGDLLSLIAPLDFEEQWNASIWQEALTIIAAHRIQDHRRG
jgi:hypothetical protein